MSTPLPIDEVLPELLAALATTARVVLEAPPGAGKTTRVPLALLDQAWTAGGRILLLEPRRLAARAAAEQMARTLGEAVGETVGYRIRFDVRCGPRTRIEVLTEGLLTRMIQDDPELPGVAAIVFDEFHERHLQGDLGLALALEAQAALRPDLRLLLMSATLDSAALAAWLPATRVSSPGRSFAVAISHQPPLREETIERQVARAIDALLARGGASDGGHGAASDAGHDGNVLVFLPGKAEIERCRRLLLQRADAGRFEIMPLHGELALAEQARVLQPGQQRRLILATNLAESSLTVPGVRAVIDSGLAREPRFDPQRGMSHLVSVRISEDSAVQRAGRAGRLGPGVCVRLWPAEERLESSRRAEILSADLADLALQLALWGGPLRWLDPPPPGALAQARDLLLGLGALDTSERPTALGRKLAGSGTHPRLATMLEQAGPDIALACDLLALLEGRDPLLGTARFEPDLLLRWQALARWRESSGRATASDVDPRALAAIDQLASQWRRRRRVNPAERARPERFGELLAVAWPDRIGQRGAGDRYRLLQGSQASLADSATLAGTPWLVAFDLTGRAGELRIRRAAAIDPRWIDGWLAQRSELVRSVTFERASRTALVSVERRVGRFVIERKPVPIEAGDAVLPALLAGIRGLGLGVLPFDEGLQQWLLRLRCLRDWMSEAGLPDASETTLLAELENWLAPWLDGLRRLDDLRSDSLRRALEARLDHHQRELLAREAPVQLSVPSGRSHRLRYRDGEAPVLAVKLQELFGLADGPRIAGGRVAVLLELLSPAGRPVQLTADLRGFWDRTYPEVRKELKGRYPKHPWPEDPWKALPTARSKRAQPQTR
jgi:ATP-dependent helicase HrpB